MEKQTEDYLKIIDEIEKVRSRNNVNWMDILRVAFRHAPDEARIIMGKINSEDKEIANLLEKLGE
jgi:hypothetical protein|tara:strand:- start:6858 stop:7052 length:195 start_codon:yes stop_codon:yes gene_type:complete